jgi:hypothetical protein
MTSLVSLRDAVPLRMRRVLCRYRAPGFEVCTRSASLLGATRVLLGYIRPGCILVLLRPVRPVH